MSAPARQAGFGYIAAIVLLVVLATLSTAMLKLNTTQQATAAQDVLAARASMAARAGVEWGMYRVLRGASCNVAPQTLSDFFSATGFNVTVSCSATSFREGESAPGVPLVKTTYRIDAIACNATSCPDNSQATQPGYVERRRVATVCATAAMADCD
jgi:MSHA biogenesis protein MshP